MKSGPELMQNPLQISSATGVAGPQSTSVATKGSPTAGATRTSPIVSSPTSSQTTQQTSTSGGTNINNNGIVIQMAAVGLLAGFVAADLRM